MTEKFEIIIGRIDAYVGKEGDEINRCGIFCNVVLSRNSVFLLWSPELCSAACEAFFVGYIVLWWIKINGKNSV